MCTVTSPLPVLHIIDIIIVDPVGKSKDKIQRKTNFTIEATE